MMDMMAMLKYQKSYMNCYKNREAKTMNTKLKRTAQIDVFEVQVSKIKNPGQSEKAFTALKEHTDLMSKFPNGFASWMETHHEIVTEIALIIDKYDPSHPVVKRYDTTGTGGMYELAESLTDKFEQANVGVNWGEDKEYFDVIEEFIQKEFEDL